MKELNLKDSMHVSDSKVRGVVTFIDKNGKIVFTKENKILEAGRKFIKEKTFGVANTYTIGGIVYGTNGEINPTTIFLTPHYISNATIDTTNSLYTTITATISSTDNLVIRELGLFINDTSKTPFSRVVFEPVSISSTESYTVVYTIYF